MQPPAFRLLAHGLPKKAATGVALKGWGDLPARLGVCKSMQTPFLFLRRAQFCRLQFLRLCFLGNIIENNKILEWSVCKISTKCLEGTTERSDSNRARSVRINEDGTMCLEGTTPKDGIYKHSHRRTARPFLWRSAFQARRVRSVPPDTACPVTIAALRSAFQALSTKKELGPLFRAALCSLSNRKQTLSPFSFLRRP